MPELWIPPDADVKQGRRYRCLNCGKQFFRGHRQQYIRHTAACIRKNPEKAERMKALKEESIFTTFADPEAMAWVRKRRAQGLPAAKHGRPA